MHDFVDKIAVFGYFLIEQQTLAKTPLPRCFRSCCFRQSSYPKGFLSETAPIAPGCWEQARLGKLIKGGSDLRFSSDQSGRPSFDAMACGQ